MLEKFYKHFLSHKINYILSIAIFLITLIPIAIYLKVFRYGLSKDNADWAAFGSYIGGVYGPIFSLVSIFILIYTLREMRKTQLQDKNHFEIQLDEQRKQRNIDDIVMLTNMIRQAIDNNPIINDIKKYPNTVCDMVRYDTVKYPPNNEEDMWNLAYKRMKNDRYFDSEVHILGEVLERIELLDDDNQKLRAKMIIKGLIPQGQRFLFKCYANAWQPKSAKLLRNWPDFCHLPDSLKSTLEEFKQK